MTLFRILGLTAMLAFFALVGVVGLAWSNGVRFYGVESGSMAPAFGQGDLVVDVPTTPDTTFRVGDVVTFHPTPGYTATHRIVAIDTDGITTKGDANPSNDVGFIQPSMVAGRVAFSIPYGGYVAIFLRNPVEVVALLVLLIGLAVAWELTEGKPSPKQAATNTAGDQP